MNSEKRGGENLEASREELIGKAEETVCKNLTESGIAQKVIKARGSIFDEKDSLTYSSVSFNGVVGKTSSIFVDVLFQYKDKESNSSPSVQPVLYRIAKSRGKRAQLAERIWQGIDDESKRAIAQEAVSKLREKFQGTVDQINQSPEEYGDKAEDFLHQAQTDLAILDKVEQAFESKKEKIEIDNQLASLKISPEKE